MQDNVTLLTRDEYDYSMLGTLLKLLILILTGDAIFVLDTP